ncbi:unnamed protein product, partial [Porites evermanni]
MISQQLTKSFNSKGFVISIISFTGFANRLAIRIQPNDVTITPGTDHITIHCMKSEDSEVKWYRNGNAIKVHHDPDLQVTSDGSLFVRNPRKERDEGTYRCEVSSWEKVLISRLATVRFPYLNDFSVGDQAYDIRKGESAVLRCQAPDSFPHRTIQWSKITAGIETTLVKSSHYVVSKEGDLHFAFADKMDEGVYVCTVTNLFLSLPDQRKRRTINFGVLPDKRQSSKPPQVAEEFEKPKTALKGEKFILECIVYGKPVPSITLKKKGTHVTLGTTTGNVNRLVIDSFAPHDAGKYMCTASDDSGASNKKSTVITMEAKPEWVTKPQDTTSVSHSSVVLPCMAFGFPVVQYKWYFNSKPVKETERYHFSNGNLTIKGLTHSDNGMYQCFVGNKHGELHADVELTVSAEIPAGFGTGSRTPQSNLQALVHTNVELICNPTGEPKPTVRWRFGPMLVQDSGRHRILSNGNLRISNLTESDSGEYTCEVSNRLAKASRKGFLRVVEYMITSNMPDSARLSVVLGQEVTFWCGVTTKRRIEVTFQWFKYLRDRIVTNPHLRTWKRDIYNNLSNTSVQKGYLKIHGARYSDSGPYTCEAKGNGESIMRKSVVLTIQGPPDPPIRMFIVQEPEAGESVNISWELGKSNGSPIRKMVIQYSTQFSSDTWQTLTEVDDPAVKGLKQIQLSPWLRYTFRAVAVNDIGNSTPSAQSSSIQTPAAAPSSFPLEVRGEDKSSSSLSIKWKPLPLLKQNGPGLYYVVYYRREDGKGRPFRKEIRNSSSYVVTGLNFYTKYEIRLQAANVKGFGPKSPPVFGYSGEKVPVGAPRDLHVRITTPTSAHATWTGVPNTREAIRGKLLGYKVYFWKTPSGQTPEKNARFQSTIDTSTTLHLEAFTSYRFQVVAYNSVGDGPASNVVGPLTTPESVPDSPRSVSINVQNDSHILLQWQPPEHVNGAINGYQVTAQKQPEIMTAIIWRTNDSSTEILLDQIDFQAVYRISVLAINRMGKGPPVTVTFDLSAAPAVAPTNVKAGFDVNSKEARLSWKSSLTDIEGFRIFYWGERNNLRTVDVDRARRRKEIISGLENEHKLYFQIAAFKIIHGGHYIVGPRSKKVTAGNGM